jgi:GDP-L-fucose synthase
MNKDSLIYVAGHRGLVGSAILANLKQKGYSSFVHRTHKELDLTDSHAVNGFFSEHHPEYVFLAAAHVGGIAANNLYRADFIYQNLLIQTNVIHAAYKYGAKKLLFLGSTCIYPCQAPQPIKEEALLTSPLEYTNEPYAIAKIAGLKMCESYNLQYGTNFLSVMPTNLYGPNDNFHLENSHVVPAIVRKMHLAKCLQDKMWVELRRDLELRPIGQAYHNSPVEVIRTELKRFGIEEGQLMLWGSGAARRELLWSEEMADACVFLMEKVNFSDLTPSSGEIRNTHINIGTGNDCTIRDLCHITKEYIGFHGQLFFDLDHPDGPMQKLSDTTRLTELGWKSTITPAIGIPRLYDWYLSSQSPSEG